MMGNIGNFYDGIRTSQRHTKKTDAPAVTQAQGGQTEVSSYKMKYHYLTGVQKSFWERHCIWFWRAVALFVLLFTYDIFFNGSRIFINILLWTSR